MTAGRPRQRSPGQHRLNPLAPSLLLRKKRLKSKIPSPLSSFSLPCASLPADRPCDKVSGCLSHSHSDWLKVTLHFSPPAITCFPALPNVSIRHTRCSAAKGVCSRFLRRLCFHRQHRWGWGGARQALPAGPSPPPTNRVAIYKTQNTKLGDHLRSIPPSLLKSKMENKGFRMRDG